jgi:hypothetical protein
MPTSVCGGRHACQELVVGRGQPRLLRPDRSGERLRGEVGGFEEVTEQGKGASRLSLTAVLVEGGK